ncbi:hypothetical protein C8Q80DRAFT_1184875 [Daedaleopsis nitida]|nr:hypothetical protein C8Q80DRAFT_1184875 [Daedaleopsis nitida]
MEDSMSLSFSSADHDTLERLNIRCKGTLRLQPPGDLADTIPISAAIGLNELWSNEYLCNHLILLNKQFANNALDATLSRMFIDAFFFRAMTMFPVSHKATGVLNNAVPAVRLRATQEYTVSGVVDRTVYVSEAHDAIYAQISPEPTKSAGNHLVAFIAAEATSSDSLTLYLPKILLKLIACAKLLQKSHIRGAFTTGRKWVFIVVDIDDDNDGASYWISDAIEWRVDSKGTFELLAEEGNPALIAGILASWFQRSYAEFNGDEWFYKELSQ